MPQDIPNNYTANFARPLARRAFNIARPLFVAILERKPCVLLRFRVLGWKVRFIFSPINFFDKINLKK